MDFLDGAKRLIEQQGYFSKTSLAAELNIDLDETEKVMTELVDHQNILPVYSYMINNTLKFSKTPIEIYNTKIYSVYFGSSLEKSYEIEYKYRSSRLDPNHLEYFPSRSGNYIQKKRSLVQKPSEPLESSEEHKEITTNKAYLTRKATGIKHKNRSKENSVEKILKDSTYTETEQKEESRLDKYLKRKAEVTITTEKRLKKSFTDNKKQPKVTSYFAKHN